jgi:hypothetical protein
MAFCIKEEEERELLDNKLNVLVYQTRQNSHLLRSRNFIKSVTRPSECRNALEVALLISSLPRALEEKIEIEMRCITNMNFFSAHL